jgi:phosphoglycolate phosphatase-like HAD superfamily hydrolase
MRKANAAERFVMIGDTTWDAIATVRAGVPAIGLLSGGFGEDELRAAGCEAVFAGADELTAHLDRALGILIGVTSGTAGT